MGLVDGLWSVHLRKVHIGERLGRERWGRVPGKARGKGPACLPSFRSLVLPNYLLAVDFFGLGTLFCKSKKSPLVDRTTCNSKGHSMWVNFNRI